MWKSSTAVALAVVAFAPLLLACGPQGNCDSRSSSTASLDVATGAVCPSRTDAAKALPSSSFESIASVDGDGVLTHVPAMLDCCYGLYADAGEGAPVCGSLVDADGSAVCPPAKSDEAMSLLSGAASNSGPTSTTSPPHDTCVYPVTVEFHESCGGGGGPGIFSP